MSIRDYIDGKLLSQVDTWDGERSTFKNMKVQFYNYAGAMSPDMRALLEAAETHAQPIRVQDLTPQRQLLNGAVRFAMGQIFKKTALQDLETFDQSHGFEAWRQIVQRQRPITGGALRSEQRKLLDPEGNPSKGVSGF